MVRSRARHINRTAVNADTGDQVTQYLYGTTLSTSAIATSNLLSQEIYPDSTGPTDRITHTYNRQAEKTSLTDQNGTVRQFDHDALARPTHDRVTTLGADVDGSVRRIERAYDVRSNTVRISSFDNAASGSGSVVNEVTFEFNDFNQSIDTGQAHDGAVVPGTTPSVAMSYADGSNNTIRPTSITYPNGRTITRNYGTTSSITNKMNQVFRLIDDDSIVLAEYERLGLSTFVQQTSPQPDLRYTLISPTLSIDPATGDIYSGLDRFGRIKDVRWSDVSAGTDLSRIEYGYDRASNRTWRENPSDPNREHDWLYAYDSLHRLSSAERGQLNTGHTAITNDQFNQCWSLDPTGNWQGFQQDDNADGTADLVQTRTANEVNEISDITNTTGAAWATPTYDPNGNSLVQPRPDLGPGASMTATYDAWNRMVKLIDNDSSDVLLENQFDGRNFRITAVAGTSPTRHYYFTDNWQCVEERTGTATVPERQHVWGMRYIDDLVLRDRATGTSTSLNERFYHLADANWNTTAIVDDSGAVQERYEYTPHGVISYFAAGFTPRATSTYDTRYTYTNREWTPVAGLHYFRNRWYDALLGRFSSRDPIGYVGSQWGLYEYVHSMPLAGGDPLGLDGPFGPNVGGPPSTIIPIHPPIDVAGGDGVDINLMDPVVQPHVYGAGDYMQDSSGSIIVYGHGLTGDGTIYGPGNVPYPLDTLIEDIKNSDDYGPGRVVVLKVCYAAKRKSQCQKIADETGLPVTATELKCEMKVVPVYLFGVFLWDGYPTTRLEPAGPVVTFEPASPLR